VVLLAPSRSAGGRPANSPAPALPTPSQHTSLIRTLRPQGSLDGQAWSDLRRHADDATLSLPGQIASWAIAGRAAVRPWRMFRVLLTEAQRGAEEPHHVCLSNIELYGYLYIE
jgi:hypothetical protein